MFGRRGSEGFGKGGSSAGTVTPVSPTAAVAPPRAPATDPVGEEPAVRQQMAPPPLQAPAASPARKRPPRTQDYYDTKSQVFSALIDTIDLSQLAKLDGESAREEIRDIVNDIITIKNF